MDKSMEANSTPDFAALKGIAVITGGSSGMGRAFAMKAAQHIQKRTAQTHAHARARVATLNGSHICRRAAADLR